MAKERSKHGAPKSRKTAGKKRAADDAFALEDDRDEFFQASDDDRAVEEDADDSEDEETAEEKRLRLGQQSFYIVGPSLSVHNISSCLHKINPMCFHFCAAKAYLNQMRQEASDEDEGELFL